MKNKIAFLSLLLLVILSSCRMNCDECNREFVKQEWQLVEDFVSDFDNSTTTYICESKQNVSYNTYGSGYFTSVNHYYQELNQDLIKKYLAYFKEKGYVLDVKNYPILLGTHDIKALSEIPTDEEIKALNFDQNVQVFLKNIELESLISFEFDEGRKRCAIQVRVKECDKSLFIKDFSVFENKINRYNKMIDGFIEKYNLNALNLIDSKAKLSKADTVYIRCFSSEDNNIIKNKYLESKNNPENSDYHKANFIRETANIKHIASTIDKVDYVLNYYPTEAKRSSKYYGTWDDQNGYEIKSAYEYFLNEKGYANLLDLESKELVKSKQISVKYYEGMNSSSGTDKSNGIVTKEILKDRKNKDYFIPSSVKNKVKKWFPGQEVIFFEGWK